MAQTVIDNYSAEIAQGNPPNYAPVKTNQLQGRLRVATFTRQYATEAAGDDTALVRLPKGARIIDGAFTVSATTGSATLAFGLAGADKTGFIDAAGSVSDNTAFLVAAAAVTVTTRQALITTQALNALYETEKEVWLTVTTAAAAMAAQKLMGYIVYAVD